MRRKATRGRSVDFGAADRPRLKPDQAAGPISGKSKKSGNKKQVAPARIVPLGDSDTLVYSGRTWLGAVSFRGRGWLAIAASGHQLGYHRDRTRAVAAVLQAVRS
jgi:hypothetical protein